MPDGNLPKELYEEVGIFVGGDSSEKQELPTPKAVHQEPALWKALKPDLGKLTYICTFVTPDLETERQTRKGKFGFDTAFYLYLDPNTEEAPTTAPASSATPRGGARTDDFEVFDLKWLSPAEAIQQGGRDFYLGPPQSYLMQFFSGYSFSELRDRVSKNLIWQHFPMRAVPVFDDAASGGGGAEELHEKIILEGERQHGLMRDNAIAAGGSKGDRPPVEPIEKASKRGSDGNAVPWVLPGDHLHPDFKGVDGGMRHRMIFDLEQKFLTVDHSEISFDMEAAGSLRKVRIAQTEQDFPFGKL
jgi:hypothetical protein